MIIFFIIFIIGLCVGSFLNVVVDRPMKRRSIIFGRSACDFCHHELAWFDLIPLFSFILIQGRCRYCHKKLSLQYPLVELLTATLFFTAFYFLPLQYSQNYAFLLVVFGLLTSAIALFIADIKYQILPNGSMIFFAVFSFLLVFFTSSDSVFIRLGIAVASCLPFLLIFIFSKGKAMGFGDVKLSFIIGYLLGFPAIIPALYIAFLTGAIAGIILILGRKVRFHGGTIAFGPFLLVGTALGLIWGNYLWNYFKLIIGF